MLTHDLTIGIGDNLDLELNDSSYSQFVPHGGVSKDTIVRPTPKTIGIYISLGDELTSLWGGGQ